MKKRRDKERSFILGIERGAQDGAVLVGRIPEGENGVIYFAGGRMGAQLEICVLSTKPPIIQRIFFK